MLRFSIYKPDSLITVDNASATIDLTALAPNVVVVAFQVDQGSVEYDDRPNLRTPFTDPSPYQSFINLWTTAAAAQSPALLLEQAKQVKLDLVDAIFHHKRRSPYDWYGWLFEASDDALWALTELVEGTQSVSSDAGGIVTAVNAAFASLTAQINGQVVNVNNSSAGAVNGWSATNAATWAALFNTQISPSLFYVSVSTNRGYGVGSGGFANMAALAGATISGVVSTGLSHPGTIATTPLNASTPVTFQASDLHSVMYYIASRRNALNDNRMSKRAAINGLTTIPDVIAYDATTGWSS